MDSFRPQRSPGSDRFLGLFSHSEGNGAGGVELHEEEVLWSGSDSPERHRTPVSPATAHIPNPNPSPLSPSPRAALRRPPERYLGILAALSEEDRKPSPTIGAPILQRKPSISSSSSSSSTSTSPASSASSSARMIPAIPKPKTEYSLSLPKGKIHHQSAPVNVPVGPGKARRGDHETEGTGGDEDGDDDEMLPPHEIVSRASAKLSPMTTFSVLEGAGRTLKGRDLRRVRNAVWRKTGFLD